MTLRYLILLFMGLIACSDKKSQGIETSATKETASVADGQFVDLPAGASKEEFADVPGLVGITVGSPAFKTATGHYLNGKREGTWVEYYPNGLVMKVTTYVNGQKEGICLEMANNNQLARRYFYHQGKRQGEYKEYNSAILREERTYVDGKIDGLDKIYYDNGKIMEEGLYKNGLREGISKWYDQEGKLSIEYEYKNGELIKK